MATISPSQKVEEELMSLRAAISVKILRSLSWERILQSLSWERIIKVNQTVGCNKLH
jgi:hypothetical protein